MKVTISLLPESSKYKQGGSIMSTSQMIGIRMFCIALGWAFGALLFGTEATWLFGVQSFIWCGFAGGTIGILLTTK
jgi:hypothetical protein